MAQPKSNFTIQTFLEASNLMGIQGTLWIGAKETGGTVNCGSHYAASCSSCSASESECNGDCIWSGGECAPPAAFVYTANNSIFGNQNWAPGYPKSGGSLLLVLQVNVN